VMRHPFPQKKGNVELRLAEVQQDYGL